MTEVISQGIKAGEFTDVDPRAAALTIGAALEGSVLLWLFDRRILPLGAQIRSAVSLVVRGMEASRRTARVLQKDRRVHHETT